MPQSAIFGQKSNCHLVPINLISTCCLVGIQLLATCEPVDALLDATCHHVPAYSTATLRHVAIKVISACYTPASFLREPCGSAEINIFSLEYSVSTCPHPLAFCLRVAHASYMTAGKPAKTSCRPNSGLVSNGNQCHISGHTVKTSQYSLFETHFHYSTDSMACRAALKVVAIMLMLFISS